MSIIVQSLHIYPLKSGQGISVPSFNLTERGPEHDRLWMVVREPETDRADLKFITQRDKGCEALALIKSDVLSDKEIIFSGMSSVLHIRADHLNPEPRRAGIHKSFAMVQDAGRTAAEWISHYLQQPARIVRMADDFIRAANPIYYAEEDQVSLADGAPILVTSTNSLNALQDYFPIDMDIKMSRFRPNIVLSGLKPFEEDIIRAFKIGDAVLEICKPCDRCPIPNIDQETGAHSGTQVTSALVKTRFGKGGGLQGAFFGQNAVPRSLSSIKEGDQVQILSTQPMHPALEKAKLKFEAF